MKITLTKSQIETIQEVLATNYVESRIQNETARTIEPSWFGRLLRLGDAIEKQTGITNSVRHQMDNW